MILENYKNPAEFKSIYNLYELLVNTLVDLTKSDLPNYSLEEVYQEVKESEAKEDDDLDQGDSLYNIESVKALWRNFINYQDFEIDTNKTSEAHNLRKASILAQLYLAHRLVIAGINYDTEKYSKNLFHEISAVYAVRYLHLSSTVYDLKGYFVYLDLSFIDSFTNHIDDLRSKMELDESNKTVVSRYYMSKITILKFRKILGYFDTLTSIEFLKSPELNEMLQDYFELIKIEDVPNKGERRASDDYIFIMEEIFRNSVQDPNTLILNATKLFRIGVLDYCLKQSIYNFDIALQLTRIYIDMNAHKQYSDKFAYLEFKGVQLESLGYIVFNHLMSHNDEDTLKFWYKKYNKYLQKNSKDLRHLKSESFKSQNYEKVDEFYDYEQYLEKSYFYVLSKYLSQSIELRNKMNNYEQSEAILSALGGPSYEFADEKYNDASDETLGMYFTRTQDLGVFLSKYDTVPKYTELSDKWPVSKFYTTAKEDPVFGYLKFSSKCNYKPGIFDSLSIFEHPF